MGRLSSVLSPTIADRYEYQLVTLAPLSLNPTQSSHMERFRVP
jgi:hypothetical protein